jgi:hypothetical protein
VSGLSALELSVLVLRHSGTLGPYSYPWINSTWLWGAKKPSLLKHSVVCGACCWTY